ncbi:MAG: hypothetical protein WCI05_06940, partial [Myxococcales bacterium]
EQLLQADAHVTRIEQAANTVRRQLEQSRGLRDVVKTLCLNDKLSQVDVAGRTARERRTSLRDALRRGDTELANHEFTILTVLRQRTDQTSNEAAQCIGEEVSFVGQTQVTSQVDTTLPEGDQTQIPSTDPTLVSAPPQDQSPWS